MASPASTSLTQPVLHPIQRIHTDLLGEIFVHCIPGTPNDWRPHNWDWRPYLMSDQTAPLLLCRVCSSWRSLAISMPRLWQTFVFRLWDYSDSLPDSIRTWLKRSGALSLTILFHSELNSTAQRIYERAVLEALSEFSSRWGWVHILEIGPGVRRPTVGVLPNLHDFDGDRLPIRDFPFTSAPNLRVLSLHKLPPNCMASISRIPWGRLQDLCISSPVPISAFFELLRCCPLLEALAIFVKNHDGESISPVPRPLTHDALRRLSLGISQGSDAAVDYLTLPALKELLLDGVSKMMRKPYCISSVLDLLTRSKCALHELSLKRSTFKPHHLLEYLQHPSCQTLVSLTVDNDKNYEISIVDDQILSRLTLSEKQDTTPLCPGLAKIQFKKCYHPKVNSFPTALGRMVHSRCFGRASPSHRLRSLDIVTYYPIFLEDDELLQLARNEAGLKLSCTYSPIGVDQPIYFPDTDYDSEQSLGDETDLSDSE